MARPVTSPIDLRTSEQKRGISSQTRNLRAITGILKTVGQAEKARRESQQLERIATAVASGATTIEAINAVANQPPEISKGVPGILQRIGGAFQTPGGGVGQGIQSSIISQALKQALTPPTEPKPFTLGQGQERFTGTGERVAGVSPKPAGLKQSSSVITDPRDPNKAIRVRNTFDEQGNIVNQQFIGEATLAEKIGGVAAEGLQKGTQTKIEKDIIELQTTLTELDAIDKQFNESFFTFRGKAAAGVTAFLEKAEVPIAKDATEFLEKKTAFFADSKRVFLKFRKFITGVAGGIEEFNEIAKATIDPEKDSPTQFKAKLESMRDNAKRTQNVLLAIRNSGLDPNNPAVLKQVFRGASLKDVPIDVSGDITLEELDQLQPDQAGTQQFTPEQIEAELTRRGVR